MADSAHHSWLHRFALLTAAATFLLLGVGGLVTSKGAGMAVPDWPTSYGYNMFALPFKFWTGGIFYEHTHRLVASGVGLLTTILAVWLWLAESRRRVRWMGVIAFFAIVLQGVLGGLRVVWLKDQVGIFHATLAQLFFVLMCAIAMFTSNWWKQLPSPLTPLPSDGRGGKGAASFGKLRGIVLGTTLLVLGQLILGAAMRHQHAGLAISDFPLAYGKLWPAMDTDSVMRYNQKRIEVVAANPITAFQIGLQMAHRFMAVVILIGVAMVAWRVRSWSSRFSVSGGGNNLTVGLQRLAFVWLGLILIQLCLGAWTIWSNKAADVATAHVLIGALSLVTGTLWCIISFRRPVTQFGFKSVPTKTRDLSGPGFQPRTAVATGK
jgi:cytochrome c oxidase assembly protein subunit 15